MGNMKFVQATRIAGQPTGSAAAHFRLSLTGQEVTQ